MFIEFTDATSRNTSGGIKIGIHGIKLGKFRLDLPGWAGVFSDLVKSGHQPGDAALAATSEQVRQNPAALQAALFGSGHDPNKFWDLLSAIFERDSGTLGSADAANNAVMLAEDGSRTSAGPLLLVAGIAVLVLLTGGLKRFIGGGSKRGGFRRGRPRRSKRGRARRRSSRAAVRRFNRNNRSIFGRHHRRMTYRQGWRGRKR